MYLFVVALHILVCLFLIGIVLLQPGKGDIGAAFGGGGSSSFFGPRGPTNLLQQGTTVIAVMFMVTSVTLAWYSTPKNMSGSNVGDAIEDLQKEEEAKKTGTGGDKPEGTGADKPVEGTEAATPAPVAPAPVAPAPVAPAPVAPPVEGTEAKTP